MRNGAFKFKKRYVVCSYTFVADTVENLILDLLEWLLRKERSYTETIETGTTDDSCIVRPTPAGLALLKEKRPRSKKATPFSDQFKNGIV